MLISNTNTHMKTKIILSNIRPLLRIQHTFSTSSKQSLERLVNVGISSPCTRPLFRDSSWNVTPPQILNQPVSQRYWQHTANHSQLDTVQQFMKNQQNCQTQLALHTTFQRTVMKFILQDSIKLQWTIFTRNYFNP